MSAHKELEALRDRVDPQLLAEVRVSALPSHPLEASTIKAAGASKAMFIHRWGACCWRACCWRVRHPRWRGRGLSILSSHSTDQAWCSTGAAAYLRHSNRTVAALALTTRPPFAAPAATRAA